MMNIGLTIPELMKKHPAVSHVALTGSRLRGDATEWSDWDFSVETTDFEAVSIALPALTESLNPLTHLWDPLSTSTVYMMILRGPIKVDLLFNRPHQQELPWTITGDTISLVNSHFWDWILWIASKEASGKKDVSIKEFEKIHDYLLAPLGCIRIPDSVEEAVRDYLVAFRRQKRIFSIEVDPALETEVIKGLRMMGFKLGDVSGNGEI